MMCICHKVRSWSPNPQLISYFKLMQKLKPPQCNSSEIIKNGTLSSGNQSYKCKFYGKEFVENPLKSAVKKQNIKLISKLLMGRLSLASIGRVTRVSESWLQSYVNDKYENIP